MLKKKYKIIIGVSLSLISLILLGRNLVIPGLIAFIAGFLLINDGKMPWSRK